MQREQRRCAQHIAAKNEQMARMNSEPSQLPLETGLGTTDRAYLAEAAAYLENPSFLIKIANFVGKPAEALLRTLPERGRQIVADGTQRALERGLDWAARTVVDAPAQNSRLPRFVEQNMHTAATALTGAGGGMLGLPGLAVELPATTVLMLRSIASIAAEHGADLSDPATKLD